jgi:hypothetical protein
MPAFLSGRDASKWVAEHPIRKTTHRAGAHALPAVRGSQLLVIGYLFWERNESEGRTKTGDLDPVAGPRGRYPVLGPHPRLSQRTQRCHRAHRAHSVVALACHPSRQRKPWRRMERSESVVPTKSRRVLWALRFCLRAVCVPPHFPSLLRSKNELPNTLSALLALRQVSTSLIMNNP